MNIGFDLDKVFINYPPFLPGSLIDRLYRKKSNGNIIYRIPSKPEQLLRKLSHIHVFRPAMKKNIAFLKNLPKKNNKVYLISSRYKFLEKMTHTILKRYNLDKAFDGLFFNFNDKQAHIFKDEIIKKLKIDRYVDDDLFLLKYVAKRNPQTKFYWLNKKSSHPLAKNLFAIKNISEIIK